MFNGSLSLINPEYDAIHAVYCRAIAKAEQEGDADGLASHTALLTSLVRNESRRMIAVYRARGWASLRRRLIGQGERDREAAHATMRAYICGPSATFTVETHVIVMAFNAVEAAGFYREMKPGQKGPAMVRAFIPNEKGN